MSSLVFAAVDCHPALNRAQAQFIVGYGSLLQEQSKREEGVEVGENQPVYLSGYQRGWFMRDSDEGLKATYLAVIKHPGSQLNAVYFKLMHPHAIRAYDEREEGYCRARVATQQLRALNQSPVPKGEYWIYVLNKQQVHVPSTEFPIQPAYLAIFLGGCEQVAKKYNRPDFARDCLKLTVGWDKLE